MEKLSALDTDVGGEVSMHYSSYSCQKRLVGPGFHYYITPQESESLEFCKSRDSVKELTDFSLCFCPQPYLVFSIFGKGENRAWRSSYFNAVRLLSGGNLLKRFTELFPQIKDLSE